MEKIDAINKIKNSIYLNEDQKDISINIINNLNEKQDVQSYFDFIMSRVGLGFKFDVAPEIPKGKIAIIEEDKTKRINVGNNSNENENKLIIGDNYEALKNLLITHKEKIDVIYIDPPYNTESAKNDGNNNQTYKNDGFSSSKFIYKDKYGRQGWLNMMRERLILARKLLSDGGVIFISIDDSEQAYLKVLMDEIFGEENFISSIIFDKTSQGTTLSQGFKRTHEYILCYSKSEKFILNYEPIKNNEKYGKEDKKGKYTISNKLNSINSYLPSNRKRGYTIYYNSSIPDVKIRYEYDFKTLVYDDKYDNSLIDKGYIPIRPGLRKGNYTVWNWSEDRFMKDWKDEIVFQKTSEGNLFPYHKNREGEGRNPLTIQTFDSRKDGSGMLNSIFGKIIFDYAKPVSLIKWIIQRVKIKNPLVLDFFAGSGTTGQAVMQLNREDNGSRKFILCTNNENNIAEKITYERILRIIKGKSSLGEKNFKWLEKNEPFSDVKLRVFNIKHQNVKIKEIEKLDKIIEIALNNFKLLNHSFKLNNDIDIYYELNGLNKNEIN